MIDGYNVLKFWNRFLGLGLNLSYKNCVIDYASKLSADETLLSAPALPIRT